MDVIRAVPSCVAPAPQRVWQALLTAALVSACAKPTPTDPSTGVLVQVRRGPIAPVQMDTSTNTAPVVGATVVLADASGTQTSGATDATGTARVLEFPGAYQVSVATCPGAMRLPPPASIMVVQGSFASTLLVCDTGIR